MDEEWSKFDLVQKAIAFAGAMHGVTVENGTPVHSGNRSIQVGEFLMRYGAVGDLLMAGVLCDILETLSTASQVEILFGSRVKELVVTAGEMNTRIEGQTGKQACLDSIRGCSDMELLALKCAEAIVGLRDLRHDLEEQESSFWQRFKTSKREPDLAGYYEELSEVFGKKLGPTLWADLAEELARWHQRLFQADTNQV